MGTLSDEDRRRTERVRRRLNPNPRSSRPTVERQWLWVKRPRLWVGIATGVVAGLLWTWWFGVLVGIGVTVGWPWLYGGYANTKGAFLRTVQHCREELRREHMMGIMAVAIVLLTLAVGALGYKVLTLDERTVEVQRVIREVAPADNYLLEREEWVSEQELERRLQAD